jgi:hypothetical protein
MSAARQDPLAELSDPKLAASQRLAFQPFRGSVEQVQQNTMKQMVVVCGSLARMHTMTNRKGKSGTIDVKALLAGDEEFLRALVRTALQKVL